MKKIIIYITILSIGIIAGCKKSHQDAIPPFIIPLNRVFTFDEGRTPLNNNSGVTISVENPSRQVSALSDNTGNYKLFIPFPLNNTAISWSKPGFGTYKLFLTTTGAEYLGINDINLGSLSTVRINSASVNVVGDSIRVTFDASSPNLTGEKYVRLICRTNLGAVSDTSLHIYGQEIYPVQNGSNTITLSKDYFTETGRALSGDIIYLRIYGDAYYSNICGPVNGQIIFPNINRNTVPEISFAQP